MAIVLLLLIALLACSEQPDDIIPAVPALPVIDIEDHPDSGTHYRYKLLPREPLPYPVTVRVDALTRGFHARSYDFWGGEFAVSYTDYVTISPDSNIYVGAFPRVSEWQVKDNHFWVPVVTSVEMEISVITDAEITKFSLDIEREKERAYTVGKSTLTLGAHLPPLPVDLSVHEARKAQTAARYENCQCPSCTKGVHLLDGKVRNAARYRDGG